MRYTSTRDNSVSVQSAQGILTGLSPDGGLFVPQSFPALDFSTLMQSNYEEIAYEVLSAFLPEYDRVFLRDAINTAYGDNFGGKASYMAQVENNVYALELWHGPTAAFKDYALQLMPRLLVQAREMLGETDETMILVATSGDTGSAALAGYSGLPGLSIAAFYPHGGVSALQQLQMTTQPAANVAAYAVRGNFDDAQRGVKAAFTSDVLRQALKAKNRKLSSANSINLGRLVPQIVYYATSYLLLCRQGAAAYGQPIDYCVPTGNFGDILAGWYAKQMGLPVGRLVCAANQNNVLADFLDTGRYNAKRAFYVTSSPSMDILVSSNLERLLWHVTGGDARTRGWMAQLAEDGGYTVDDGTLAAIRETFVSGWAAEADVTREMAERYRAGYLCDPHTAVAFCVQKAFAQKERPMVVLSTASPYKFCGKVLGALGLKAVQDPFDAMDALAAATGTTVPANLAALRGRPVRFGEVISPEEILSIPLRM